MLPHRFDPQRYQQWRNPSMQRVLLAYDALGRAGGFRPRDEVIPDQQHTAIAPAATWDHRVTLSPGSFLWGLSASVGATEGFKVQITDFATRSNLYSGQLASSNLDRAYADGNGVVAGSYPYPNSLGQALTIPSSIHLLSRPRPIVEPGILNVQITNLAQIAQTVQLVLWLLQPDPMSNERTDANTTLAQEIARWRAIAKPYAADTRASSGLIDPSMATPAYHLPFSVSAAGSNIIIPGVPGRRIAVHQLFLYNTVEQNVRLLDATRDLTGPLTDLGLGGSFTASYQTEPHFVLSDGAPFTISLSGADATPAVTGAVNGFVKYRLFQPQFTPGQQ